MTWYPAGPGPAATIRFVVWPASLPTSVRYTQVLPTATGNGMELALANDLVAVAALVAGAGLRRALVAPPVACAALEASEDAPDVPPVVSPGISGAVLVGTPHPARAMMAAPARTALADPCLLM